eukprot:TRINITY_DN45488_c0_g1_i2.p1 TRINITY_DN45488_c0_g1~~TRINITY_DN45488_c0_g1_i2.p1  ORF type:complete len:311 (+),score=65.08 TRINITY_DN45488_c0_g1_i2:368-1300(+)
MFLQTHEQLVRGTADHVKDQCGANNNRVLEIRFHPPMHTLKGLTNDQVVAAVVEGFALGVQQATGRPVGGRVVGGVVIGVMRSFPAEHGVEMAELAKKWLGQGVIGWDIAGDEGLFPLALHRAGIERAIELGVPTTVHAGEWGSGPKSTANPYVFTREGEYDTLPNIELAVELGCKRIGHGLTLHLDPQLMKRVAEKGVVVECCLTTNSFRIRGYSAHPLKQMLVAGCACSLNTDDKFMAQTNSVDEVLHAVLDAGLTWADVKSTMMVGAKTTFYWECLKDERMKEAWLRDFEAEVDGALELLVSRKSNL